MANSYEINHSQLSAILPQFFEDYLHRSLARQLQRPDTRLHDVLTELQGLAGTHLDVETCLEQLDAFRLNQGHILSSVYNLKMLLTAVHPNAPDHTIEQMTRARAEAHFPAAVQQAMRKAQTSYREHHFTSEYPYKRWWIDLSRVAANRASHHAVKALEARQPPSEADTPRDPPRRKSPPPTPPCQCSGLESQLSDLQVQIQALRKAPSAGQPRQQVTWRTSSGPADPQRERGPTRGRGPIPLVGQALEAAKTKYSHNDLLSKEADYPEEKATALAYAFEDGTFLPHKPIPIAPFHVPVFIKFQNTGKNAISRAVTDHFVGRCASCGMKGHSAKHPLCVYQGCPPTWQLCTRCGTGFHAPADCCIELSRVAE